MEKKYLIQDIEIAEAQNILAIAQDQKTSGGRLGQICATLAGESLEILYSFERDNILKNYKIFINARAPELQSITATYSYAFIYENEIHDLFGVTFRNLALDYGGKFYKISKETPWNPLFGKEGEN